jgi:hypothetical protein
MDRITNQDQLEKSINYAWLLLYHIMGFRRNPIKLWLWAVCRDDSRRRICQAFETYSPQSVLVSKTIKSLIICDTPYLPFYVLCYKLWTIMFRDWLSGLWTTSSVAPGVVTINRIVRTRWGLVVSFHDIQFFLGNRLIEDHGVGV